MEMILLGAGASYGAEPVARLRPPLGINLFSCLKSRFRSWNNLPADVQIAFASDEGFERGMDYIDANGHREAIPQLMRDMARYFVGLTMSQGNKYYRLAKALSDRRHGLVVATMNYDMLLESAVSCFFGGFHTSMKVHPRQRPVVLKLHGSCAMIPDLRGMSVGSVIISGPHTQTHISAPIRLVPPAELFAEFAKAEALRNDLMAPCMALYARGKRVSHCPDAIEQIQLEYREGCSVASAIHVVGCRISEDPHIWDPIHSANCSVNFFNPGENDCREFLRWSAGRSGGSHVQPGGLDSFLARIS